MTQDIKKKWMIFTEDNDWEGETWNVFIPFDPEIYEEFKELLDASDQESYSLEVCEVDYSEKEINHMPSNVGYMDSINIMGPLDWAKLKPKVQAYLDDPDDADDVLYKLGIMEYAYQTSKE